MAKRMSWDWVQGYPIFIYTTFIKPRVFKVDVIVGTKGNQNAGGTGPRDEPTFSYTEYKECSKNKVVGRAFVEATKYINQMETLNEQ